MLRRKILTSAMASVMALTSISVVAFADDEATDVKNVKTKADLEAYVKGFDGFRDNELYDYGSIAGERFLAALEYAENVLDDTKATIDNYTVAYKILELCQSKLRIYSSAELKALLDRTKSVFETDNIMNEELNDLIYDEPTFDDFAGAYTDAETYLNSNDSRILTDCYETLEEAFSNLKANAVVTKSQFRTALKNYETMLGKLANYDDWRRGKFSGDWVSLTAYNDGYWFLSGETKPVEFSDIKNLVQGDGTYSREMPWGNVTMQYCGSNVVSGAVSLTDLDAAYTAISSQAGWGYDWMNSDEYRTAFKTLHTEKATDTQHTGALPAGITGTWYLKSKADLAEVEAGKLVDALSKFGVSAETVDTREWSVTDFINKGYDKFIDLKTTSKSTDGDIVDAYNTALNAVLIFNAFEADATTRASQAAIKTLLKNYHDDLEIAFRTTAVEDAWATVNGDKPIEWDNLVNKGNRGEFTIDGETKTIANKKSILAAMRDVTSGDIKTTDTLDVAVKDALALYEAYCAGDYDLKKGGWDQTDAVATSDKASVAGWTIVYRAVKYALEDKFPAGDATYTKKDVSALIEDSYKLVDDTGDAKVFAEKNGALVEERQNAVKWLREANKLKGYKEGDAVPSDGYGIVMTATEVWNSLNGKYKDLNEQYAKYKYGYSDIYNKISDVLGMLDNGKLTVNDDLTAALNDTAYTLFLLNEDDLAITNVEDENFAFNGASEYLSYNRLFTDGDNNTAREKAAQAAYEKLLAEVDKQLNPDAKAGDVNKDGAVNSIDAALILKAVVDGTVETLDAKVADFNTDGAINALDAAAILKAVVDGTV